MTRISIEEAQSILSDLIHRMNPGDEVLITENDRPVARLVPAACERSGKLRQPGFLRDSVLYLAPDFNAPLKEFQDYTE